MYRHTPHPPNLYPSLPYLASHRVCTLHFLKYI